MGGAAAALVVRTGGGLGQQQLWMMWIPMSSYYTCHMYTLHVLSRCLLRPPLFGGITATLLYVQYRAAILYGDILNPMPLRVVPSVLGTPALGGECEDAVSLLLASLNACEAELKSR